MTFQHEDDLDLVELIDLENAAMPRQVATTETDFITGITARRSSAYVLLAVAAAAALLGFAVGRSGRPEPPPSSHPASLPVLSIVPNGVISGTGRRCTDRIGRELQLGVEVENLGPATAQLVRLDILVASPDMRSISVGVSSCGQLGAAEPLAGLALPKLGTAWLWTALLATTDCPIASAAEFKLSYIQAGQSASTNSGAIADLGQVPYEGCVHTK